MLKPTAPIRAGLPPGPKGTLIGGSIDKFGDGLLDFLRETVRDHGGLASTRVGPKRVFLASAPDLIEQVLVRDGKHYIKHFGTRAFRPILGNGLVTSEGLHWRRQRKLMQPTFMKAKVRAYAPIMSGVTETMLETWTPGEQVVVNFAFSKLTSQIALEALFGLDDAGDRQHFTDTLKLVIDILTSRLRRVIKAPLWLPTSEALRLKRALADLDQTVLAFIAAGRARGARDSQSDDLLSRLLAATDEDGAHMSDEELRDETMTLYLAGHETTALALTWTWVLLSQHGKVEDALVREWRTVLGGRTPDLEDIANLPTTNAVITEAMRLYPPVYMMGREATKDLELGGYRVKRGTTVLMSPWVTQRDPGIFDEPDAFRPERWQDGFARRIPKFAYFPFGGGQRACIGSNFAMIEAAMLLAAVGQRYRFTIDNEQIGVEPQVTLMPKEPITATLRTR